MPVVVVAGAGGVVKEMFSDDVVVSFGSSGGMCSKYVLLERL